MGESGNEKAISKTTGKHQVRTTTIKKGWVQALPIKVCSTIAFFWIFGLCHFTSSAVYFDWPQFESENVSLLRDLRLRSSYHGFDLWIFLFTPPVFLFWISNKYWEEEELYVHRVYTQKFSKESQEEWINIICSFSCYK